LCLLTSLDRASVAVFILAGSRSRFISLRPLFAWGTEECLSRMVVEWPTSSWLDDAQCLFGSSVLEVSRTRACIRVRARNMYCSQDHDSFLLAASLDSRICRAY
jgi:hypothetical protein